MSVESNRLKQIRRETDLNIGARRLENHHWDGLKCNGGTEVYPLLLSEHAFCHWIDAMNGDNSDANFWSARKVAERMTPEEGVEFNHMLEVRQRRLSERRNR